MDLRAPFTGTLYLPDKEFLASGSPILLADGRPVAAIRWHTWSQKFEVLDASGALVAACEVQGFLRHRYTVRAVDGRVLVDLRPGAWRPYKGAELTVGGRRLAIHQVSMWSDRRFEFVAPDGVVGRISPTTGVFTFRPDSYAFELLRPALSALEAISLAQALRLVARGQRQQAAAAST
ncbi:hypothetical protein WEI85_20625 [Actinomycetes bacterium KLBMP 9797]